MSQQNLNGGDILSLLSSVDYSSGNGQFRLVMLTGARFVLAGASTDEPVGVLQNKPKVDEAGAVAAGKTMKIVVGAGGVTAGCKVASGANGTAVIGTTGYIVGKSLETMAEGEVAEILWQVTHL